MAIALIIWSSSDISNVKWGEAINLRYITRHANVKWGD
jgi:hypothetical protein